MRVRTEKLTTEGIERTKRTTKTNYQKEKKNHQIFPTSCKKTKFIKFFQLHEHQKQQTVKWLFEAGGENLG